MFQFGLPLLAIVAGFVGLIWSADRFVNGSAALAYDLGVSKLIVGLTVVALGTSAPEVAVSVSASLKQAGDLAVGNAIGSNLANMGLVLAITAIVVPLTIRPHLLKHEVPALVLVTALAGLFLYDARLVLWEGLVLLLALALVMGTLIWRRREESHDDDTEIPEMGLALAGFWLVFGLAALIASSEILIWGATELALLLGVTPLVVGLTVIAIGTSLPELAATLASAIKGHQDIAIGNIVGSNLFNLLAVMAVPALLSQPPMESQVFWRDFMAMGLMTLLLTAALILDYRWRNRNADGGDQGRLGRRIGTALLLSYGGYCAWLFVTH